MDGRDKPGHDGMWQVAVPHLGLRFCVGLGLTLLLLATAGDAAARSRHRRLAPYGCCGTAPDADPFDTDIPPIAAPPEPPPSFVVPPGEGPENEPPFVPGPSPRPGPAPYPQGFVLDVPVRPQNDDTSGAKPAQSITRYRQVADALAACWTPPAEFGGTPWKAVTLRVSFKRDGSINGMPRIPYVDGGLTGPARSDLTRSLMDALRRCTPLPFSTSLGGAVAGQVFALRFIEQDQD